MLELRIVVPGEPVAKGRARLGVVRGHAVAYTPAKTRHYEDIVREQAVQQFGTRQPLRDVALTLRATFFRGIPASWSKAKREAALLGTLRPTGRPDLDNMVKAITDGLNGVAYHDDAQIVEATVAKFYSLDPRVDVVLSWNAAA